MVLLSCVNEGFCYLNLTEITKFKYEWKTKRIVVLVLKLNAAIVQMTC